MDGRALLAVERSDGQNRLADLYMRDPLRLLFPRPPANEPFSAVLATISGGLVGGDRVAIEIEVRDRAALQLVGQSAEKVYRSSGADTRVDVTLKAAPGALMEMLPQGTILFDGARLRRRVAIEAADDALVLAGEILTLGRAAMGEKLTRGLLSDRWFVSRGGRLVWADALALGGAPDGGMQALRSPSGFAEATALGTVILLAREPTQALELARGLLESCPAAVRGGASLVDGVLVARFLSADGAALRNAFGQFWKGLRAGACGLPERLPTIWQI